MPDFSRWGANGGDPSLNAIARTDRYLDALAAEQLVYSTDPADAELASLMAGWRDEVRRPLATGVATPRDAAIALQRGLSARHRGRMSMAVLGSVAAAMLCLGGFGALVYGSGPGDALYGLRTSVFGEQRVTRDDQVALAAQTQMQEVQQLIDQGQWTQAQDKLQSITTAVQSVEDTQTKQQLQDQLNQLTVKVETRDPNATVPPAPVEPVAPGVPDVSLPGVSASDSSTTTTTTSQSESSESSESPAPPPPGLPPGESSSTTATTTTTTTTTTSTTTTTTTTSSRPQVPPPPVEAPDGSSSSSSSSSSPKPASKLAPAPAAEEPNPAPAVEAPKQLVPEAPASKPASQAPAEGPSSAPKSVPAEPPVVVTTTTAPAVAEKPAGSGD